MYVRMPLDLASRSMLSVGSEPIDRKQIIGVLLSLSAHIASMSNTTPSANYTPRPHINANQNYTVSQNTSSTFMTVTKKTIIGF